MSTGRQPIPVWVEGIQYPSITIAYAEISATTPRLKKAARQILDHGGGVFYNHDGDSYHISLTPPKDMQLVLPKVVHVFGEPLLKKPSTSRLGYSESRN
jgi:hypothetical protein